MSVRLKLKILITAKLIGLYSLGNIPAGPVVVLDYSLRGCNTPNLPKKAIAEPRGGGGLMQPSRNQCINGT